MSKSCVQPQHPGQSKETLVKTDWNRCLLCQEVTSEVLRCPAESRRCDVGAGQGYSTFSSNIVCFSELHALPMPINLGRLDEGNGIETTLLEHKAKWHKSCHTKFNITKLQRAEKRKSSMEDPIPKKYIRKGGSHTTDVCFFCDTMSSSEPLREASTFGLDSRVRNCALVLQDEPLLAKLSAGDMIAQEAKYHPRCLVLLYNKVAAVKDETKQDSGEMVNHGIALAELLVYIDEARMDDNPVFKLADLVSLYSARLAQLGVEQHDHPHSTRLKNRILAHFPDLAAHKEGRDVLLAFDKDLGPALRKAFDQDYDDEAICLARAANIVRRDMLKLESTFTGSFDLDCQVRSVPHSLLALVTMILNGPDIKSQGLDDAPQATVSIAQLLQYNICAHERRPSVRVYHSKARETPLPIYVGLTVHARTRKRDLIETLFDLGMSISYDRVMEISTTMGNRVCEQYHRDQVVCPPNLREGLFTTAAIDNIDHNPSSTTATDALHGTAMSLFQHPNKQNNGHDRREHRILAQSRNKRLSELPQSYTNVPPLVLAKKDPPVPKVDGPVKSDGQVFHQAMHKDIRWLETVEQRYLHTVDGDSNISWAAYHANQQPAQDIPPSITAMLPLFHEDSKSVAMIRHSMDMIKLAVQELNPAQVPVITLDQPLYTIAKQIQWNWPENYGENRFVIVLGGLHIEMAALKVIGNWLEDCGWVEALVQAKVASAGTADSFLKASHVTRTRHAHQVTASSLYILLKKAYTQYSESLKPDSQPEAFDDWCERRKQEIPQFHFWHTALQLELLVFTYIKALRMASFSLYVDCLTNLAPWFFSLDHTNYARWVPVHIRDMVNLSKAHPQIAVEFNNGNFTIHKTRHVFSSMAIDQAHEQNNAAVKCEGGAIGLTQSPEALRRWMVAGPEVVRMTAEFEASIDGMHKRMTTATRHHEQTKSTQVTFAQHVKGLVEVIEEMGNPFLEESKDLLRLDTRDIIDPAVATSLNQAEEIGKQQYQAFMADRLQEQSLPISEPIKKNKLLLFSRPPPREKSKSSLQVSSLKSDVALFSRLYIACQSRDGNLEDFFRHENQACPPSLSQLGKLRLGTKSDLLHCLESTVELEGTRPATDVTILDGAVVVNFLKPLAARTFDDYALHVFLPYIKGQLQRACRVDVIWDQYLENSLKSQTRSKRGKGIRRRVDGSTNLPGNWQQFLRIDANKTELFAFLAKHITHLVTNKQVVTTDGSEVVCIPSRDTSHLAPCDHEEADTRMILHMADAVNNGFHKILLRTVDTDVVVLAVAAAAKLNVQELWVAFGTGKNFRYIPIHEIAVSLGPDKSQALPFFHAYTGCDTVSAFSTRGKKTAWDTWKAYEAVTQTFQVLSTGPAEVTDENVILLERFTILLYDRTSSMANINEARQELFTKKGRAMDAIPPTRASLLQHIKRAVYQGGHCWGKMLQVTIGLPSAGDWGWVDPHQWKPMWTTLPEAGTAARELIRCGCKKGCTGRCKCKKAALKCTALCLCGGHCDIGHDN